MIHTQICMSMCIYIQKITYIYIIPTCKYIDTDLAAAIAI